jgi:anti-sigma factor RsiW
MGEGEPDERAELARRLAEEPDLAAEVAELDRIWRGLELSPAASAPPGFAGRIAARVRAARPPAAGGAGFAGLRWASALVLLLGIGGGTAISHGLASTVDDSEATLAESYLEAARELAESGGTEAIEPADDATEGELEAGENER